MVLIDITNTYRSNQSMHKQLKLGWRNTGLQKKILVDRKNTEMGRILRVKIQTEQTKATVHMALRSRRLEDTSGIKAWSLTEQVNKIYTTSK